MSDLAAVKEEVCRMAKRAFDTNLQRYSGGNLSALAADGSCVIKPSGIGYAECTPQKLMVVDLDGRVLAGDGTPSKDMPFHLEVYKVRPDVRAIMHTHSPWANGFAVLGETIPLLTLHARAKLGELPLIPLAPGGKTQGPEEVGPVFADTSIKAALMERHGPICVGASLLGAQHLAELVEESAQIAYLSRTLKTSRGDHDHPLGTS